MAARLGVDSLTFCTAEGNISGQITKNGIENIDVNNDEINVPVGTFGTVNVTELTASGEVNLDDVTNADTIHATTLTAVDATVSNDIHTKGVYSLIGSGDHLRLSDWLLATNAARPASIQSYYNNARAEMPELTVLGPTETDHTWNIYATDDLVCRSEGGKFALIGPLLSSFPGAGELLVLDRKATGSAPTLGYSYIDVNDSGDLFISSGSSTVIFPGDQPILRINGTDYLTIGGIISSFSLTCNTDLSGPASTDVRCLVKKLQSHYKEISLMFVSGIVFTRGATADPAYVTFGTLDSALRPDFECGVAAQCMGAFNDGTWHYDPGTGDIRLHTDGTLRIHGSAAHTGLKTLYTYTVAPFVLTYIQYVA